MLAFFSNWILFFPIAFSLYVAMRLNEGKRGYGQRSSTTLLLRAIVVLFFMFAFLSIGIRATVLSLVWIGIIASLSVVLYWKNRRLERSAVLLTMMNAENYGQQQLIANAFVDGNHGYVRRRAVAVRRDMAVGIHWAASLELRGIAKSLYEKLALRLKARYGLSLASSSNVDVLNPLQIEQEVERLLGRLLIFSWSILLLPIIALFMTFVAPTFQEMFDEFGLELPPVMRLVFAVTDDFYSLGWTSLLSLIPLVFLLAIGVVLLLWLFPVLARLPVLRWFFRDHYRNLGFMALANAVDSEPDLVAACHATGELVPVSFVAERYRAAGQLLAGGATPSVAFFKAGLLSKREVAAVGFGLESNNPTWGLRQLASWKTERMLRRYSILVQCLVGCITLCLALVVGAFAVGVIQALTAMIIALG